MRGRRGRTTIVGEIGVMMRMLICAELILLALVFPLAALAPQSAVDPKEIIDRADRLLRGDSSHANVEMTVATSRWQRTLAMEIWSEGTEKALVRITKPKKEAGTATLKVESDIWNYLPKIDRTIRVPSSMMASSWMGSHFTNDDLVKESRLIHDYDIVTTYDGERESRSIWEFTLTPLPDAPVVWGKIVYEIEQESLLPIQALYFGEDGRLRRTMTFHDVRKIGGRTVPTRLLLVPADDQDEYTQMIYHDLEFDIPLPERTFSLSQLRR